MAIRDYMYKPGKSKSPYTKNRDEAKARRNGKKSSTQEIKKVTKVGKGKKLGNSSVGGSSNSYNVAPKRKRPGTGKSKPGSGMDQKYKTTQPVEKSTPTATTTRSGKTVTNKKVIAKRRAARGEITNKKRAATLGQAPKNKLRAKKMAAGEPVKSKLSASKRAQIRSGTTKSRSENGRMTSPGMKVGKTIDSKKTATSKRGKIVTNKKRAAKINAKQGSSKITNRLRARKLSGKKTKARG